MANYRAVARRAARRYGLDPNVFSRQIQQESGFNPNARSPAGAQGIAQIMPDTARGWGVNPHDPVAALDAAAKNMARYVKRYGSYRNALVAYNAGPGVVGRSLPSETQNYIKVILGGRNPSTANVRTGGGGGGKSGGGGATYTPGTQASLKFSPGSAVNVAALLQQLQPQQRPQIQATAPTAPSFSATAAMPTGYQAPQASASAVTPTPKPDIGGALEAVRALTAGSAPGINPGTPGRVQGGYQSAGQIGPRVGKGRVKLAPGANRAGVNLSPSILHIAQHVASLAGPLTVGTGTNHNRMTVNGNVSDHWGGNAVDIPSAGHDLIRIGQDALRALGVPRNKVRGMRGGLYNVPYQGGRVQVIFNTHTGGDHTNHLHLGWARR